MKFAQFLTILKARKRAVLMTTGLVVAATIIVSLVLPSNYTATTSLVLDFKGADPVSGLPISAMLVPSFIATEVDIINSHNVALKVVDALKLNQNASVQEKFLEDTKGKGSVRDWMADLLLKHLRVEPAKESSVVEVSYKGSDPEFAAAVANAFAQGYIATNLELKVAPAKQAATWFDGQMKNLRDNVEKAQARLSQYQRDRGIIAVDERLDVENARLNDIATQLVLAQSQRYDSVSRQRQMNRLEKRDGAAEGLPEVIANPLVQGLKSELARAESKLADVSQRVGENHPDYQRILAEVHAIRSKIALEVKNASAGITNTANISQQREAELRAALAAQKAKLLDLTRKRDDFAVLVREVENAQKQLDAAMQRSGQARLESQINQTNIAVLNPAIPPIERSSPRILLNTILATILGALLGIAVGFAREMSDRRVRSPEDLAQAFDLPVIGVLSGARQKRQSLLVMLRKPPAVLRLQP